jgi:CRISPR-associated protein Cas2
MPMTVVVVRDVADRYRGFLASIMPEIAPGVFVDAELSRRVRERLWGVLSGWWDDMPGGSVIMIWRDEAAPGQLGLQTRGLPVRQLVDLDGVLVLRRLKANGSIESLEQGDDTIKESNNK